MGGTEVFPGWLWRGGPSLQIDSKPGRGALRAEVCSMGVTGEATAKMERTGRSPCRLTGTAVL